MKPEIVQTQSGRYKTIVSLVIKRQQQTTISKKRPMVTLRKEYRNR